MKSILISKCKSSELNADFDSVHSIQIDDSPFDRGAFGEVYDCNSINGNKVARRQVIKVFLDDGSGSAIRGLETIHKLQDRIIQHNASLKLANSKQLQTVNALGGLPQFSFKGTLNGRRTIGYSANFLHSSKWLLFSQLFNEENLTKRKVIRNAFYKLPIATRLEMAYDLAEGFSHLEQMSFIYADLNAKNFFVNQKDGQLCLIDYEGGAINDNPETFGKPGEWLAPEINEQLLNAHSSLIKVDLNTDTWAVAVGIHFMLFNFHPLFFLKVRGRREMASYFANHKWPEANQNDRNFRTELSTTYDSYIRRLNYELPKPLVNAFSETINNGFSNRNKRLSYRQWLRVIEASAQTVPTAGPPGVQLIPGPMKSEQSLGKNLYEAVRKAQSGIRGFQNEPLTVSGLFQTRSVQYALGISAILVVGIFLYKRTVPPDVSSEQGQAAIVSDNETRSRRVMLLQLKFIDRNLTELDAKGARVQSNAIKTIRPVLTIQNSNRNFSLSVRLTGPNGKTFSYAEEIVGKRLDGDPITLKEIDLSCPKCPLGVYRFDVYHDSTKLDSKTFEIY
jgi:serine/threonine protein kinase